MTKVKKKVHAVDGGDGYNGINIYADDQGDMGALIDQIQYNMSLATDEAGYTHIQQASRVAHERYDVVGTDDVIWDRETIETSGGTLGEIVHDVKNRN